jgi:hypothetical protein
MDCVSCALGTVTENVLTLTNLTSWLKKGLDVFGIKTIAPEGRSSHLSVVDEEMLGCEPREILIKLADGLFVLTTL